jgi:hypothetical protein
LEDDLNFSKMKDNLILKMISFLKNGRQPQKLKKYKFNQQHSTAGQPDQNYNKKYICTVK